MPATSPPTDPRYTFVGSDYGPRPSEGAGGIDFHPGLDFNVRERDPGVPDVGGMYGYPVFSVADGTVVYTAAEDPAQGASLFTRGYGNVVVIRHDQWSDAPGGGPWFSLYAHLLDMRVRTGQRVLTGEQVARVGATSNGRFPTMGAHLHFEIRCYPIRANPQAGPGAIIPSTNDSAFLDWEQGRRTFQTRRRETGTTVDPIWWFAQRGVNILRRDEPGSETRIKGRIFGGNGPQGQAMMPRGVLSSYAPASLPTGASYGRMSARVQARTTGMGALAHLGAAPPDEVRITSSSGQEQVLVADMSELPYQPPVQGRLEMPLIPVTDPATQTPPGAIAIASIAATGAIIAGTILITALDAKHVASRG